ncbi:hypothetical protein [Chryseobacterium sp. A301]
MKKFWIVIPIFLWSCTKESKIESTSTMKVDSTSISDSAQVEDSLLKLPDSIVNKADDVQRVLATGVNREETDRQIIRSADAKMLPFTIGDQIKNDNQQFVLKLAHMPKGKLKVQIQTKEKDMNIRVNQVRYPDGTLDGPFGRTAELEIASEGEVWLMVGKSNMASSSPQGNFTIHVENETP